MYQVRGALFGLLGLGGSIDGGGFELFLDFGGLGVFFGLCLSPSLGQLGGLGLAGLEFVDAAGGVDQLLLAGVEWVAVGADFNGNILYGRVSRKGGVAAVAVNGCLEDLRVDSGFHNSS